MKRKTCIALLAFSSSLITAFAAEVDKCTEKFEACKVAANHELARCKARGGMPEQCENRHKGDLAACDKELKKCQGSAPAAPGKPAPKATPKPKK